MEANVHIDLCKITYAPKVNSQWGYKISKMHSFVYWKLRKSSFKSLKQKVKNYTYYVVINSKTIGSFPFTIVFCFQNYSCDRENLMKFEAEHFEIIITCQFIWTAKGQYNF